MGLINMLIACDCTNTGVSSGATERWPQLQAFLGFLGLLFPMEEGKLWKPLKQGRDVV